MKNNKIIQNTILVFMMAVGAVAVFIDEINNFLVGISLIGISALVSCSILAIKRKGFLTYTIIAAWLFIPTTFLLGFLGMFNTNLDNFLDWARVCFAVGVIAIPLTGVHLFRVNR
ncbi:MAG: hypothetical protein Q4F02_00880 [Candidatus Saccharibacteria bacterium]|nr:hypothetical protein [Candidatus Saccharibacteria bacterium]